MRTKIKEKSLTLAGFEPTTSELEHRRATNWATRPGWVTLWWINYLITLFVTHAKTGWLVRSCLNLYYHCKHVKDTIIHQLLPGRNIFWTPRAERTTAGLMPPGDFYPAVRTGSSNTRFFFCFFVCFFFGGQFPQTSACQNNTCR